MISLDRPASPWLACAAVGACAFALQGCFVISYSAPNSPAKAEARPVIQEPLYYHVAHVTAASFGSAEEQLNASMQANGLFAHSETVGGVPEKGLYVDVYAKERSPSIASAVWVYVSWATIGLIPAYSGSGGYDVRYTVYRDQQPVHMFEYPVRRQFYNWIVLLPFVWVNAITDSEKDAMKVTTEAFFHEAQRSGVFQARPAAYPGVVPGSPPPASYPPGVVPPCAPGTTPVLPPPPPPPPFPPGQVMLTPTHPITFR